MDRFEVAVLAAAAGVSCCHTDDYKAPLLCRRGQLQATIHHHDNHNNKKCHNNHSDWSMVNFFVAIQSHISTNLLTILGTRLSPTLIKAQAKQAWTDTRSNKPPSIMTIIIIKTATTTTNCLVNVFWRNDHCGNSIILPTILNCHLYVI